MEQQTYHYQPGLVFKLRNSAVIAGDTAEEITGYLRHNVNVQWKKLFIAYPLMQIKRLFCTLQPADIAPLIEKAKQRDASYQDPGLLLYFICSCPSVRMAQSVLIRLQSMEEVETAYLRGNMADASAPLKKKVLFTGRVT